MYTILEILYSQAKHPLGAACRKIEMFNILQKWITTWLGNCEPIPGKCKHLAVGFGYWQEIMESLRASKKSFNCVSTHQYHSLWYFQCILDNFHEFSFNDLPFIITYILGKSWIFWEICRPPEKFLIGAKRNRARSYIRTRLVCSGNCNSY